MKLLALILALLCIIATVLSFIAIIGIVIILINIPLLLLCLISGVISRCRFAWISAILCTIACGFAIPKQMHSHASASLSSSEIMLERGHYRSTDYILKSANLIPLKSEKQQMQILRLQQQLNAANSASSMAMQLGATPEEAAEQARASVKLTRERQQHGHHVGGCGPECQGHD